MALVDLNKKELTTIGLTNSKSILLPRATLASIECLTIPLFQEVVVLADFRCTGCQKRVADIISRMNGETESVVVSVLEKKITVTRRYPRVVKVPGRNRVNRFSLITRLFGSSFS